jgi:hypothetical protein
MSGKATPVSFMAESEQSECEYIGKRLKSETLESASAPGDWRSHIKRTMRE